MESVIIKGWKTGCCGRSAPLANLTPQSSGVSDSAECSATITSMQLDELRLCFWTLRVRHKDAVSRWSLAVQERRGGNRAAVALANKMARRLWATLALRSLCAAGQRLIADQSLTTRSDYTRP